MANFIKFTGEGEAGSILIRKDRIVAVHDTPRLISRKRLGDSRTTVQYETGESSIFSANLATVGVKESVEDIYKMLER